MDPGNIPFNALIVGPTNSGKTHFLVNQLCGPFCGKFDYIVLICPTFAHNRTLYQFAEKDPFVYIIICEQHQVETWLKLASFAFEGDNTLIILDGCASSKDVKNRTGELVKLAFSARHVGISVWVMAQQLSSIAKPFHENVAAIEPAQPIEAPGPNIPALREQLAILVSTGKCKEAIDTQLTHDQVKRLSDKEVMRAHKRYETYVGAKTTETLIDSFLSFATKALGIVVRLKDADALHAELKNDYIITKELSSLSGGLALRCGRMLAVANAFLITVKHVDFSNAEQSSVTAVSNAEQSSVIGEHYSARHPSRDSDGHPLSGLDEVDKAEAQ